MRKLFLTGAMFVVVSGAARAEFFTGNDLYSKMTSTNVVEQAQSLGYVMGVYDAYVHIHFCPKEQGITAGQILDLSRQALAAMPATRHQQAYLLLRETFKAVWPCGTRQQNFNNNRGA